MILDLGIAEIEIKAAAARLREAAGDVPLIAFGSHVDKDRLDEARAAGCVGGDLDRPDRRPAATPLCR